MMAEDPPQQPVERRDQPPARVDDARGLDSMMVAKPFPFSQLPDAAPPQANVGGDGRGPSDSSLDVPPMDYDG
jgi:hypothetical protein